VVLTAKGQVAAATYRIALVSVPHTATLADPGFHLLHGSLRLPPRVLTLNEISIDSAVLAQLMEHGHIGNSTPHLTLCIMMRPNAYLIHNTLPLACYGPHLLTDNCAP